MSRSLSRYIMHVTTNVVKMYFVFFKISVARAFHAQALVPSVPPSAPSTVDRILAHTPLVTWSSETSNTRQSGYIPLATSFEYLSPTTTPTTPGSSPISSLLGNSILSLSTYKRTGGPNSKVTYGPDEHFLVLGSYMCPIWGSPTDPVLSFYPFFALRRTKWLTRRRRWRAISRQVRSAWRVSLAA